MFLLKFIDYYTIGYPILMSILWSVGAYFSRIKYTKQESLKSYPKVSIVLSAYNEEETIQEAMSALEQLAYPNLEIIVVDDKSTDNTLMLLEQIKQGFSKEKELRILAQQKNGGKATALNTALEMVSGKYLLVLDADALLAPNSVEILAAELESSSIIGAVTGKPVVRNRSTLLGKLQTLEYVGIIDGIKRTQTFMLGAIMTVSGVIVMYRVSSLKEVGGFNPEVMTEDIDVTWKLHRAGWRVTYNCRALSYILVPERYFSLLKQRKRWSIGGLEVLLGNFSWVMGGGDLNYKLLLGEMILSHLWGWTFVFSTFNYLVATYFRQELHVAGGVVVLFILLSILLFWIGVNGDENDSQLKLQDKLTVPVYLMFYWLTNLISAISSEFAVITGKTSKGKWESPDRGV
ncbi:glycosyltransferase family 2 protein [Enterococcus thailandicus]|uniref:glycosyltransferase family 2 protein n=1 Tax=Enterococcus TaxID=1350 RepID=UPI0022EBAC4F|nr:glycosyltransferase family 2 protein [Enterococcus thailandicus]MDA3964975.1 glycosyltransferase family 2 protein [Enterococcus thailandicus]MDT2846651.1 glycosyltransferase family 2 protein [Enterococcus thailandicus]GMC00630.1 glycosyl transferase [Enterococcus thailandicus]